MILGSLWSLAMTEHRRHLNDLGVGVQSTDADASDPRTWVRESPGRRTGAPVIACHDFHRALPGYALTPLVDCPGLARELGLGRVFVKDESGRFDLPAFKILGVAWAVHQALSQLSGGCPVPWTTRDQMRSAGRAAGDPTLLTATAGNHGRALARMAGWLDMRALILVPSDASRVAVERIESEGATVRRVDGGYDAAVEEAAAMSDGDDHHLFVQDTAWPGYAEIPEWIVQGYDTLFHEVEVQVAGVGGAVPDVVVVPVGVGSLMSAALRHADARETGHTSVVSVETDSAPCVLASLKAGRNLALPTSATAVEALNAGTISSIAWPAIRDGVDAAVMVSDEMAARAQARLHEFGVPAGICGGASLAGIAHLLGGGDPGAPWSVDSSSTVVIVSTDGS